MGHVLYHQPLSIDAENLPVQLYNYTVYLIHTRWCGTTGTSTEANIDCQLLRFFDVCQIIPGHFKAPISLSVLVSAAGNLSWCQRWPGAIWPSRKLVARTPERNWMIMSIWHSHEVFPWAVSDDLTTISNNHWSWVIYGVFMVTSHQETIAHSPLTFVGLVACRTYPTSWHLCCVQWVHRWIDGSWWLQATYLKHLWNHTKYQQKQYKHIEI